MISFGEPSYKEIISYQELSDIVEKQHADEPDPDERLYTFKRIISHHGPYKTSDPEYRGSMWNVKIEWEDGSQTFEPVSQVGVCDPASCAQYAKDHDLLDTHGWIFSTSCTMTKVMTTNDQTNRSCLYLENGKEACEFDQNYAYPKDGKKLKSKK